MSEELRFTLAEVEAAMIAVDDATERIDGPITAGVWRGMVLSRLAVDHFVNLADECETVGQLEAVIARAKAELTEGQRTEFLGRTIRGQE